MNDRRVLIDHRTGAAIMTAEVIEEIRRFIDSNKPPTASVRPRAIPEGGAWRPEELGARAFAGIGLFEATTEQLDRIEDGEDWREVLKP